MRVCGVDSGTTGALAIVDTDARRVIAILDMPLIDTGRERYVDPAVVLDWIEARQVDHIVVERVHAMPKNGSISAFALGGAFGGVLTALRLANLPMTLVNPGDWKKPAKLHREKGETDASYKRRSLDLARQTFGFVDELKRQKDHNRAEAALIALHGARAA